jgi:hypothetical protein
MATAFSSSLLGLAGSLVVGLLELFVTHGQNRFYRELEEWMSGFTRIGLGGAEGQGLGEAALAGFVERVQVQLAGLQDFYRQRDELRDQEAAAADRRALSLAQGVERLAALMGTDRDQLAASLSAERAATAQALAGLDGAISGLAQAQSREPVALLGALERLAEGQTRLVALSEPRGADPALIAGLERLSDGQARLALLAEQPAADPTLIAALDRLSEPRGSDPALLAALDRLSEGQARLAAMAEAAPAAAPDAALPRVLNRLADGQSRLVELAEARVVTPDDPEVRMRLRSIDVLLGRLVEESASGRDGLISELRGDMAALTRAIRNLERGDGA